MREADEFIETIRAAFAAGSSDEAKRDAVAAMQLLLAALGAGPVPPPPSSASSPPPPVPPDASSESVASSAFAPAPSTKPDQVSVALDAIIAKFRSMLPPGVEAPTVEPMLSIPFVPVPPWGSNG
jgi:hypothetical protein